jgi:uncharacterized protein YraI
MLRFRTLILAFFLMMSFGIAQAQAVQAVVVNEFANIRLVPAIGAEVLGSVSAGFAFREITARTGDSQWLRVNFNGQEGWVNVAPLAILQGDVNSLPVADPRAIPYGGNESPRAGTTKQTGGVGARATDGVRIRSGPSRGYPTIGNINFNQQMTLTGRTASNGWLQVSFDGVLGWISSGFVAITSGDVNSLPVDGIVADSTAILGDSSQSFFAVIAMMLDRLNNAQPSIDTMRAYWTDSALTGRAACRAYPAQPSDVQIAQPVLANFFDTLEPLRVDMNDAMYNVRLAIQLFIDVCNQPGTGNPVGRATVEGALGVVNLAQSQFDSLRSRLTALLPPELGGDKCLLVYNGRTEVLPVIKTDTIYVDEFTRRNYASGYCFDAVQGQSFNIQTLPIPNSTLSLFLSVSALDSPATFLAVNRGADGTRLVVGPVTIPRTTRYVVITADLSDPTTVVYGKFAFLISSVTQNIPTLYLAFNTDTGAVITTTDATSATVTNTSQTPQPGATATTGSPTVVCPGTGLTCNQLFTCEEARACLAAGNFSLDGDNDGIPCEGGPGSTLFCN